MPDTNAEVGSDAGIHRNVPEISDSPTQRDYAPTFTDGRVLLPLARTGCGFSCRYCYIPQPRLPAVSISAIELDADLHSVRSDERFVSGIDGTLISLGCDTEVFGTVEMTALCSHTLDIFADTGNPVQIATKCPLPDAIVDRLNVWPSGAPRPIVFTSVTTLTRAEHFEPGAPSPWVRAHNFGIPRRRWESALLVKPFTKASGEDKAEFVELIRDTRPDFVVVGVQYRRHGDGPPHPLERGWTGTTVQDHHGFVQAIKATGVPVFLNTLCVTAFVNSSTHGQPVLDEHPDLCVSCGACSLRLSDPVDLSAG